VIQSYADPVLSAGKRENLGVLGGLHPEFRDVHRVPASITKGGWPQRARDPGPGGLASCDAVNGDDLAVHRGGGKTQHLLEIF